MSHSIEVTMIADQEIDIQGKRVNVHDIRSIVVDSQGRVTDAYVVIEGWLFEEENE